MKEANLNPSTHITLETLAEAAVSLQPPEESQAIVNLPNIEPAEEESQEDKLERTILEVAKNFLRTRLLVA